ncbi:MAG TPA: electron transfer flavoprotein subunit alpha/FixB family protein [Actinotalea sp.]|nr:electron transfer flavoprotein subunit alpha/FixB family protein [Actinotalea sp.]
MTTAPVLVLLDHTDAGALRPAVLELLSLGRGIGPVHAVWVGGALAPSTEVLAALGEAGVEQVHTVAVGDQHPRLTPVVAQALAAVAAAVEPATVLLTSSFENKEVAGRLGVLTGAGVVVDATGLEVVDGRLVVTKGVFAGTWTTRCTVRTPMAVLALKPHAAQVVPAAATTTPVVVGHDVVVTGSAARVVLVERTERVASDRPDLGAAQVVVVGGRGTEGDFSVVEELADVLGGAVGATRVATDEGWIEPDAQIGQTGVTVSPRLYIGAGVSGAVHHRGGMQSAGTIVAVNSDPEAPIFEIADLGIVGDLFVVLPQATAELRRLKG